MKPENEVPEILPGFDDRGTVAPGDGVVVRTPNPEYAAYSKALFDAYASQDWRSLGVVGTRPREGGALEHDRIVHSYPHEWTASAFRDACQFYLRLFAELLRRGYVLKDAMPGNIMFDYHRPVYVDFYSIIPEPELAREKWLMPFLQRHRDPVCGMFAYQLVPFFFTAAIGFGEFRNELVRQKLAALAVRRPPHLRLEDVVDKETPLTLPLLASCAWKFLLRRELYPRYVLGQARRWPARVYTRRYYQFDTLLWIRPEEGRDAVIKRFQDWLSGLEVRPQRTGYERYYESRRGGRSVIEDVENPKQQCVVSHLKSQPAGTLLDIGCNTGYYCLAAARHGHAAVGLDNDERAADDLYRQARDGNLKVLPLILDIGRMIREGVAEPALLNRFRSDHVLLLAILHHIVLSIGISMDTVFAFLDMVCGKTLILEWVGLDDVKIVEKPSYFAHIQRAEELGYRLEKILERYPHAEVHESDAPTRKLLVIRK